MSRVDECAERIRRSQSPACIAEEFGVTWDTIFGYLDRAIGRGQLTRRDVVFSIPSERRGARKDKEVRAVLDRYGGDQHLLGDTYELVRGIEVSLHRVTRCRLEFMCGLEDWWSEGVPEAIRKKCVVRKEEEKGSDPYAYTDLLDLGEIVKSNWESFKEEDGTGIIGPFYRDRNKFLEHLRRVNAIRRKVMHPVREDLPEEEDLLFLDEFSRRLFAPGVAEMVGDPRRSSLSWRAFRRKWQREWKNW